MGLAQEALNSITFLSLSFFKSNRTFILSEEVENDPNFSHLYQIFSVLRQQILVILIFLFSLLFHRISLKISSSIF